LLNFYKIDKLDLNVGASVFVKRYLLVFLLDFFLGNFIIIIGRKQGFYLTEDELGVIEIYGDNQFRMEIALYDFHPAGNYRIERGNLILPYTNYIDLVFAIENDRMVLLGSNIEGVFVEEGPVNVGTAFKLFRNDHGLLNQGTYISENGQSMLKLYGDCEFIVDRHYATSYRPYGKYFIQNGLLVLVSEDQKNNLFRISNGELVFIGGHLTELFIDPGTKLKLSNS